MALQPNFPYFCWIVFTFFELFALAKASHGSHFHWNYPKQMNEIDSGAGNFKPRIQHVTIFGPNPNGNLFVITGSLSNKRMAQLHNS